MTQFYTLTEAKFNLSQTKQERFHEVKVQFRSTHSHEKYINFLRRHRLIHLFSSSIKFYALQRQRPPHSSRFLLFELSTIVYVKFKSIDANLVQELEV